MIQKNEINQIPDRCDWRKKTRFNHKKRTEKR